MATIDPITGQESYNPSTLAGDMAVQGMAGAGVNVPLIFRMTEHLPGITATMGFSMYRGANTIMRGGFMDSNPLKSKNRALTNRRSKKLRLMTNTDAGFGISDFKNTQYMGGKRGFLGRRASRLSGVPDKSPVLYGARVNNITARPRAFSRYHSMSIFGGEQISTYSPFRSASSMASRSKKIKSAMSRQGIVADDTEALFGRGLFSAISAGTKMDKIEAKAAKRIAKGKEVRQRVQKKLLRLDENIGSIAKMNQAAYVTGPSSQQVRTYASNLARGGSTPNGLTASTRLQMARTHFDGYNAARASAIGLGGGTEVGVRGNILASSMSGKGTRFMAGYFRGAQGFADTAGLYDDAARRGAELAKKHLANALGTDGIVGKKGVKYLADDVGQIMGRGQLLEKMGVKGIAKMATTRTGATALAARGAALAVPGLNVVAVAMMAYDLAAMAGEVVKSGINLAKDANKSLKGSINKPLFGMGYVDTEAAATSRARGVMAIQNSQLNARSALGSEAAMMAAHFG